MRNSARKYWVLRFLTVAAVICISSLSVFAADANAPPVAPPAGDVNAPPGDVNKPPEEIPFEQRMQKTVTITLSDTDIRKVIEAVADQAKVNVVISPEVKGNVTVKLTNVPLEEALRNILSAHGYSYVATGNMIRVEKGPDRTKGIEPAEPPQTETYEIVYADVKEVVKALDKFKSKQGTVSSIAGTSYIIVTDTESKIREITKFIKKIDQMTPQILVEARIYDITSKDSFDIGVDWQVGRNTPITEIKRTKTDGTTSTTETTADTWRLDADGNPMPFRKSKPYMGGQFNAEEGGMLRFGVLNDAVDIEMALSILHKQVGAKLLANPRVLVLDNETAKINIISEIPYQRLTESAMGGSIGTTEFKEVGIKLEVTPHLAARDEMIRLQLKPEFSIKTDEVKLQTTGGGLQYSQPVVDKRTADTILLIKNGQTVVLGGLRKKETTQDIRKVPVLGDLPLFGNLFRSESEDTVNSEMVVFVTVWIIKQPVMSQGEQQAYDATEFKGPKTTTTRAEKAEE
jgi:type IV pilus assembly protein PilQ